MLFLIVKGVIAWVIVGIAFCLLMDKDLRKMSNETADELNNFLSLEFVYFFYVVGLVVIWPLFAVAYIVDGCSYVYRLVKVSLLLLKRKFNK